MVYLIGGLIAMAVIPLGSILMMLLSLGSLFNAAGSKEVDDDEEG